jgi:hypothetical protein
MYSYWIIAFLIVLILIMGYFLVGFYNYWLSPPDFPKISFNDIKFQTGDLIFFKNYKSLYVPLTHTIFSHVGLIININKIPLIVEMVNPFVYITPMHHKLLENDGNIMFYKKILTPVSNNVLQKIYNFLNVSENLTYRTRPQNINYKNIEDTMVCSEYIFHFLSEIGIIDKNIFDRSNLLDYMTKMTFPSSEHQYDDVKLIHFFVGDHQYKFDEIVTMAIKGANINETKNKILNMPMYKGIWRREISKINISN